MKPKGYRYVNGCWNCKKAIKQDRQDEPLIFCGIDGTQMPKHPSYTQSNKKRYQRKLQEWIDWRRDRQVVEFGICDEWELKK